MRSAYLHSTAGRLRVRYPDLKGCRPLATEVERRASAWKGVDLAKVNPATGSILVLHDDAQIGEAELKRLLCDTLLHLTGGTRDDQAPSAKSRSGGGVPRSQAAALLQTATEAALKRMIAAVVL